MYEFLTRLDKRDLLLFAKMSAVIMNLIDQYGMKPNDYLWLAQMDELAFAEIADRDMGDLIERSQLSIMMQLSDQAFEEEFKEPMPTAFDGFLNTLDFGPLDDSADEGSES